MLQYTYDEVSAFAQELAVVRDACYGYLKNQKDDIAQAALDAARALHEHFSHSKDAHIQNVLTQVQAQLEQHETAGDAATIDGIRVVVDIIEPKNLVMHYKG